MTSKEAVKLARIEFEKDLEYDENNQWLKNLIPALEQTEKDLEVLEILRKIFKLDLFIYSRDEIDNNIECAGKQIYHLAKHVLEMT